MSDLFKWNYFEPRQLLPHLNTYVVACKINPDKSLSYWAVDEKDGLKLIKVTSKDE